MISVKKKSSSGTRCIVPNIKELFSKPFPEEMDEWPQYLHGADNNCVAQDTVVGPPRRLQWQVGPGDASHDPGERDRADQVAGAGHRQRSQRRASSHGSDRASEILEAVRGTPRRSRPRADARAGGGGGRGRGAAEPPVPSVPSTRR